MKKTRFFALGALLMALLLCLPVLFTSLAAGEAGADTQESEEAATDYTALYANQEDLIIAFSPAGYEDGSVPATLTDGLGNSFTVGTGAVFEDGALLNRGAILDFNEAQGTKLDGKSYTYDFTFGYEDPLAAAAGSSMGGCFDIGVLTFKAVYTQTEVTAAHAYFNEPGTPWATDYGADQWTHVPMLDAEKGTILELSHAGEVNLELQRIAFITYREGEFLQKSLGVSDYFKYSGKIEFKFGKNLNMKIYAVRVYNDLLTDADRVQNHFADLAAYTKTDLAIFSKLDNEARESLYEHCASLSFSDADLAKKVTEAIETAFIGSLYTDGASLTPAQERQNHLADLLSRYRPENLDFLATLSPLGIKAVADACASLAVGAEGSEAALKKAINQAYESEQGELYLGEFFMSFDGYSMRMAGDRDLRVSYTVDKEYIANLPDYVRVLEMGVLRTDVSVELGNMKMEKKDLSLAYATENTHAEKAVFYEEGGELSDAYHAIFNCGTSIDGYSCEQMVRGYVTIELRGATATLYEDADSSRFGDLISLAEFASAIYGENEPTVPDLNPETVLESVLTEADGAFDELEAAVESAKNARLEVEKKIASAKERANKLKDDLKVIAAEGKLNPSTATALQQEAEQLLASASDIQADANSAHPYLADAVTELQSEIGRMAKIVSLAADALSSDNSHEARADALKKQAADEAAAQEAGFSAKALRARGDVTYALKVAAKIGDRVKNGNFGEVKTLKVLSIGNSYSVNSFQQLYDIAASFGYEDIVLGILYKGGCSIEEHANYAKYDRPAYEYHKSTSSSATWRVYKSSTMLDGLTDEAWDIITIQQASHLAPLASTMTDGNLDYVSEYVQTHQTNPNAKFYYHASWSYATDHNHPHKDKPEYAYLNDPALMDKMIAECMENIILKRPDIDGLIYTGAAIAKAREYFGDLITSPKTLYTSNDNGAGKPDGYHLSQRACYLAGLVWFGTLTGEDISNASDVWGNFKSVTADHKAAIAAAKTGITAGK